MDARWVIYGTMGGVKVTPEVNFGKLMEKRASIITTTLRNIPDAYKEEVCSRFKNDCIPLFESGKLTPVVDRVMKLSEVAEAHAYVESNANIGKVVLINDL